ncbi:hypothetical protein EYF80_041830 [Liparis tanakae]|uniref:Uncharacterized protein n=1 Tax=Liparis tanakae TaxID=230148 RepID=A0A4Z2G357_9TELE|nr:hypothetical protein EYF80_041830 [Liparis tanakae]
MGTSKPAVPPCEVGTLTVTILLLAGRGSLVVTTFPPTEVPVIWKVANDCWKFLFCWNVTGVPILVDSTTLVVGVPWPDSEPMMTLGVAMGVAGVPVGVVRSSSSSATQVSITTGPVCLAGSGFLGRRALERSPFL